MNTRSFSRLAACCWPALVVALASCNSDTGTARDSGTEKTTLTVQASDADGDTLHYSWRVTAGTIDNADRASTVWTLPDGPGLHFAYVTVSDGKGGYVEQQYAVSTDAINNALPTRSAVAYNGQPATAVTDFDGTTIRLRFRSPSRTSFAAVAAGGSAAVRYVYLPDVRVSVSLAATGAVVYTGTTDTAGEVTMPKLPLGSTYNVACATTADVQLAPCTSFTAGINQQTAEVLPTVDAIGDPDPARNLRLYGHVALADGSVCGTQNDFFNLRSAATVQLLASDGTALSQPLRVNRYGDYALDAAVPVNSALKLKITCEGHSTTASVPAAPAAGYNASVPVELSYQVPNSRPAIVKMVANGPEGNVRGQMVLPLPGAVSNTSPGADHFLTYKGRDTALSACMYYRSLGAVQGCAADGALINPISLDDWKRANGFAPYAQGNTEVAATYINKMDLNLVRRMTATRSASGDIAFIVCNNPGPDTSLQAEIDDVVDTATRGEKLVACVAMEWSATGGVNNSQRFTKFLTFGPDGRLLPSVNLDGRGEKYMPGTCVACHGGTQYAGKFPEQGNPSPFLGAAFLGFDLSNYFFSGARGLTEADQSESLYQLNALMNATEPSGTTSLNRLFAGWYPAGSHVQNKDYVPTAWATAEAAKPGSSRLYKEVIGQSCRTCHASLSSRFDWDSTGPNGTIAAVRDASGALLSSNPLICGGGADLATNGAMPNALITRDRIGEKIKADAGLSEIMTRILGCTSPAPDPVYPRR